MYAGPRFSSSSMSVPRRTPNARVILMSGARDAGSSPRSKPSMTETSHPQRSARSRLDRWWAVRRVTIFSPGLLSSAIVRSPFLSSQQCIRVIIPRSRAVATKKRRTAIFRLVKRLREGLETPGKLAKRPACDRRPFHPRSHRMEGPLDRPGAMPSGRTEASS